MFRYRADGTPAGGGTTASTETTPVQVEAAIDADALLDGDGIEDGKKYRVSAGKLKEINELRKTFREAGIEPAQAKLLIQEWSQLRHQADAQPAPPEPAAAPVPPTTPQQEAQKAEAKRLFFDLFPEFKDVAKAVEAVQQHSQREDARVRGLYMESHDWVMDELGEKHGLSTEQVSDIEDVILKRIQADPATAQKYYYGRRPDLIVSKILKDVRAGYGGKTPSLSAAAQLEAAKRKTLTLPPRVQGATPAPGGAPPEPPRTMREASKQALATLRAARSAEE